MQTSVAIQVLPQGSLDVNWQVGIVDEVIKTIKSEFPDAFVGPFETTIEGDFDQCMAMVARCQRVAHEAGAEGVASYVKIWTNKTKLLSTQEKVAKHHVLPQDSPVFSAGSVVASPATNTAVTACCHD